MESTLPKKSSTILIVDDDAGFLSTVEATLIKAGLFPPTLVSDSRQVMKFVRAYQFQVVLLDLVMPHIGGMEILKQIKEEFPWIECIITTAVNEISSSVQAMRYGAFDYLVKPIDREKLIITIDRALERYTLRRNVSILEEGASFSDLKNPQAFKEMVANDEKMARVFYQAETVGPTDHNVLITGETGTGKEMLAKIIHSLSYRSGEKFIPVNMASFSRSLFEDEFFGHAEGAFTGAQTGRKGFLEEADGGTIFLDEISELDPDLQGKLLRVMEEKELYRLGSTIKRAVDVRFIASSNRNLEQEMNNGSFRKDLYYRLNSFRIHLPPLRERRKDILPLAAHFLHLYSHQNHKRIDCLDPDLEKALFHYSFPGNVRELKNIIGEAVLLEKDKTLTLSSAKSLRHSSIPEGQDGESLVNLAELERHHILKVLELTDGNRTHAARILGIAIKTLRRKLNKFNTKVTRP